MNYKETIDLFRSQYGDNCFSRGLQEKNFTDLNIFTRLSQVQSELSNKYRLYDVLTTFTVTATKTYTLDTIAPDCLNVIKISYNGIPLDKVSYDKISEYTTETGVPLQYSIYGTGSSRKLIFDLIPTETATYDIYYYKRLNVQGTVVDSGHWVDGDYNETKTDFGGTWNIPEEFHYSIVEGALARIFPDMMIVHYKNVQDLVGRKQITFGKVKGFLGV